MKTIQKLFILLAVAFSAQANAQSFGLGGFGGMGQPDREMSAGRYGQGNALRAGQAFEAEIVSVRNVTIKPNAGLGNQGAGAAVGGSLGALAASQIKGGQDRWLVTTAVGALGALAGAAVASPSEVAAQEVVFKRLDGGGLVVVTQAGSTLAAGDRVFVTDVGGEIRISKR
jgi:outer membrane lipoprotein SlyB